MNYWQELINTFSNKPGFFSSKRLERFAVFTTMLVASAIWLYQSIFACKLSAGDLMIVVGGWLAYAGFNIVQGKKDFNISSEKE